MRVAFGEAWGNAFSSMMRGTPVYADTRGPQQSQTGITLQFDRVPPDDTKAWFNEAAVGNFLYSISVSPDMGFGPIHRAMLNGEQTTPALTMVFSARKQLTVDGKGSAHDTAIVGAKSAGVYFLNVFASAKGVTKAVPTNPVGASDAQQIIEMPAQEVIRPVK